jgi:hypothetical protein
VGKDMARKDSHRFNIYLSSSFLSYGISTSLGALLSLFLSPETLQVPFGVLLTFLYPFVGGFGTGYFVSSHFQEHFLKMGVGIGAGAFFLNFAMSLLLFGCFEGALWILMGFVLGTSMGTWARRKRG